MTAGFGTADEIKTWAPMKYPDKQDIRNKFDELSAEGFRAVVTFKEDRVGKSPVENIK